MIISDMIFMSYHFLPNLPIEIIEASTTTKIFGLDTQRRQRFGENPPTALSVLIGPGLGQNLRCQVMRQLRLRPSMDAKKRST